MYTYKADELEEDKNHSKNFVNAPNGTVLTIGTVVGNTCCHLIHPQNAVQLLEIILYHDYIITPCHSLSF
jgi:hypothetical protein